MPSGGAKAFNHARAQRLAECDSAEDYQDELDRQAAEDERRELTAEWWADQDEEN